MLNLIVIKFLKEKRKVQEGAKMKKLNLIDLLKMAKNYLQEEKKLYENPLDLEEEYKLVKIFDNEISKNDELKNIFIEFMQVLNEYREFEDFISSDREAAAVVLTFKKFEII